MFGLCEIYIPEIGTYVKFKILPLEEIESFVAGAALYDRDEYFKYVIDHLIFNMKPEIVESLKMMSKESGKNALEALYNGCVMLNPGVDIETWVKLTFLRTQPKGGEDTFSGDPVFPDAPPMLEEGKPAPVQKPKRTRTATKISKNKFLNLAKYLKEKVIGQDEAINAVVNALKRSQTGLGDETRPLGVFLFAGSSGVGKTHLARELHKYLYGDSYEMVRIDCGEYQHKHENQKLLGSPPGYLGHEEGGHLTNMVKNRPNTVILLDEVEKAHPDIWNTFLRVFDEGMLTDNKGNEISFRNAIIIMTTNLGNDKIVEAMTQSLVGFGGRAMLTGKIATKPPRAQVERLAYEAIKKMFRPEFLNRIDKEIVFNHLSYGDFTKIAELELKVVEEKLARKGILLQVGEGVVGNLIELGVDNVKGARGMAQVRRDLIEDQLADILLDTRCPRGTIFELVTIKDSFGVNVRRPSTRKKTPSQVKDSTDA